MRFALNHMTVARLSCGALLDLAARLGMTGVELRNDLPGPLFDGLSPEAAGEKIRERGLRLLALAEVKRFNDWSPGREAEALALMRIARAAGAEGVSLIPRNDGGGMGNGERQASLRLALRALRPMLEDHGLIGFIEPLGFESCPLRLKAEAVEAIEALDAAGRFRLVHDTFHHHLAGGGPIFPDHTGIIHVSGVTDPAPSAREMEDRHRGLVEPGDRLGNLDQLRAFAAAGWDGPVSFEAFSPETHAAVDPEGDLRRSMEFIRNGLAREAA